MCLIWYTFKGLWEHKFLHWKRIKVYFLIYPALMEMFRRYAGAGWSWYASPFLCMTDTGNTSAGCCLWLLFTDGGKEAGGWCGLIVMTFSCRVYQEDSGRDWWKEEGGGESMGADDRSRKESTLMNPSQDRKQALSLHGISNLGSNKTLN